MWEKVVRQWCEHCRNLLMVAGSVGVFGVGASGLPQSARAAEPSGSPFGIQTSEIGALDERPVDITPTQRPVDPPPFDASRPPAVKPSEIRVSTEARPDTAATDRSPGKDTDVSTPPAANTPTPAGEVPPASERQVVDAPPARQPPPAEVARDRPMPPSGDDAPGEAPTSGFIDPFAPAPAEDAQPRSVATQPQAGARERGRGDDTAPTVIVRDSLGQAVVSGDPAAAASVDSDVAPRVVSPNEPARDMGQASEEAASGSATTGVEGGRDAPASPAREGAVPPTPLP